MFPFRFEDPGLVDLIKLTYIVTQALQRVKILIAEVFQGSL